jgi:hypothetical protein
LRRKSTTWTCHKTTDGEKCETKNPRRLKKCTGCGKSRPPVKRKAHEEVLRTLPYDKAVKINGGEFCGICGREPKPGRRLHRDHDHRTGEFRGLLCFHDNSALRPYMTLEWCLKAVAYLQRAATYKDVAALYSGEVPDPSEDA